MNEDVQEYAAQEIRNAIAFIEEHTGEKWDWDYYFECAKRVNYATKCRLEWLEMSKSPYPQVFGSNLALYTETNYMAISGRLPIFEKTDRKIMRLAEKAYKKKKMAANEYPPQSHRVGRSVALLHGSARVDAQLLGHRSAHRHAVDGQHHNDSRRGHARKPRAGNV